MGVAAAEAAFKNLPEETQAQLPMAKPAKVDQVVEVILIKRELHMPMHCPDMMDQMEQGAVEAPVDIMLKVMDIMECMVVKVELVL